MNDSLSWSVNNSGILDFDMLVTLVAEELVDELSGRGMFSFEIKQERRCFQLGVKLS